MKYTLTFITLFAGLFCTKVNAQGWQWGAGGTGPNGEAMAPATDAWGNVYTIGYYVATTATFGTLVLPGTAGAFNDMILIKYDSRGNLVWGVRLPVFPASIATDNEGDLYMLGTLGGTVNLGGVTLTDPSTTKPAMFVAKFGPSGNAIWGDILGTLSFLDGEIAASNEVVYITGSYFAASQQIGPFTVTNTDPSGATNDIFLAKLDVNGNVKWAKGTGGSGQEYSTSVAVTPTGQAYIAGNFTSPTIPFGSTVLSPTAGKSIFLAKYDTSGNVLWATSPNGPTGFPDTYVTSDHAGSAILSGTLPQYCTMAFGTHALTNTSIYTNGYVAKYSPGGIAQWAKEVAGFAVQVWGAEADACDDIWVCSDMSGTDTVDGHITPLPAGSVDPVFFAKFDSGGNYLTYCISPTGGDDDFGMGVDGVGNVFIGGDYYFGASNYYTFGPTVVHDPAGLEGLFAAKYTFVTADTTFLRSDSCLSDSITLVAPASYTVFLWSDGSGSPTRKIFDSGTYWVACTGSCGQGVTIDTFKLVRGVFDTVYKHTDTIICAGSPVTLTADGGYTSYLWSDGSTGRTMIGPGPGTYWVTARGNCTQASMIDTFTVVNNNIDISFSLGPDTSSCTQVALTVPVTGGTYLWQDGATGRTYIATKSGTYYVALIKNGCSFADTVNLKITDLTQNLNDTILCREKPVQLVLNANVPAGAAAIWSTGSILNSITVTDTGRYWVTVSDTECTASDTIHVSSEFCDCEINLPNAFTPNEDGKNDFYFPELVTGCKISGYSFAIYNRWGQQVFYSENPGDKWNGYYRGVPAELGTYMYYLKYTAGIDNKKHNMKGDVTLVR